jgi:hypothetical protein
MFQLWGFIYTSQFDTPLKVMSTFSSYSLGAMIVPHPFKLHAPLEARTATNIQIFFGSHSARSEQSCCLAFFNFFISDAFFCLFEGEGWA